MPPRIKKEKEKPVEKHENLDNRYVVIKDNREKKGRGWTFTETNMCAGMVRGTLQTGDYTLIGYENVLCIERKGRLSEFANNIAQERFWRELERMREFPVSILMLEFTLQDVINWPAGSGIPKWKWKYMKIKSKYILSCITKIQKEYPNIKVMFVGNNGQYEARLIFQEIMEGYQIA